MWLNEETDRTNEERRDVEETTGGGKHTGAVSFPKSGLARFFEHVLVHHHDDEVIVFAQAIVDGPL